MGTQSNDFPDRNNITLKEAVYSFKDLFAYFLQNWLFILIVGLLGGAMGLAYSFVQNPTYTATTTFVLEDGNSGGGLGQYAGIAAIAGFDLGSGGGGIFQNENIVQLYQSRTMIESTLLSPKTEKNGELLVDHYIDFSGMRESWEGDENLRDIHFTKKDGQRYSRTQDSVLGVIVENIRKENLQVGKLDKKLSIIKIDIKSKSEEFSKLFNDQLVKNVNDFYVQTKVKKTVANMNILVHQRDSVLRVLENSLSSSSATLDATPNLNPTRQSLRNPIQRAQVTVETNKAVLSELVKNLELTRVALRKETPLIQLIDVPIYPLANNKIGPVKAVLLGGIVFGFLAIIWLLTSRIIKKVMA